MTDQDRSTWLETRRSYIGASDTAAIAGMSPWTTPLQVYLDKIGALPDSEMTMALKLGLRMEPVIASLYEDATGAKLVMCDEHQRLAGHAFIGANPDRQTEDRQINVQLKKAAFRSDDWGEQGSDDIPEYYLVQVQQEMLVTGQSLTHLAVLFLQGQEFCYYAIPANPEIQASIVEICTDFWNTHIVPRCPPEPDFQHESTLDLVKRMHKLDPSKVGVCDDARLPMLLLEIEAMETAKAKEKEVKKEIDSHKAALLHAMGDMAQLGVGEYVLTRKTVERKAYSVDASKYQDFRVKKLK